MTAGGTTRIKICGVTSIETARVAAEAGADAIGLVIDVPGSPRCLSMADAESIARSLPPLVMVVAVFKDPSADHTAQWPKTWIQLHGDEDEALVARVAATKHVIKGFRFDPEEVHRWNRCPHVSVLLIDGSAGGRGESFNHQALADLQPQIEKPIVVAGGLTADNVAQAVRAVRPFAVDVSSGVESAPGIKDPELIRRFCRAVAEA